MLSAIMVCIVAFVVVDRVWTRHGLYKHGNGLTRELSDELGLGWTSARTSVWHGLYAVVLLYLGPIVVNIMEWFQGKAWDDFEPRWIAVRNYVFVCVRRILTGKGG